jgi:hypothetical protein
MWDAINPSLGGSAVAVRATDAHIMNTKKILPKWVS